MIVVTEKGVKNLVLLEHNPTFHTLFHLFMFTSSHLVIQLAQVVGEGKVFISVWAIHFFSVLWLPLLPYTDVAERSLDEIRYLSSTQE